MTVRAYLVIPAFLLVAGLGACGGGGGSSTSPPGGGTSPTGNLSLSGTVTDDASPSPAALAGATVALYPTGVKLSGLQPLATATAGTNGTWSIAGGPAAGTYLLQITPPDSTHATLHKDVTLVAGANVISTTRLTILSATEQTCIADFNQQRVSLGVAALTVDNAAMIAARAEAQLLAAWSGSGSFPDPTQTSYKTAGGAGSVASPDWDSGASDCGMATTNLLNPTWDRGNVYPMNASPNATWLGFGIAFDTIGGVSGYEYAAAVVTYP